MGKGKENDLNKVMHTERLPTKAALCKKEQWPETGSLYLEFSKENRVFPRAGVKPELASFSINKSGSAGTNSATTTTKKRKLKKKKKPPFKDVYPSKKKKEEVSINKPGSLAA